MSGEGQESKRRLTQSEKNQGNNSLDKVEDLCRSSSNMREQKKLGVLIRECSI